MNLGTQLNCVPKFTAMNSLKLNTVRCKWMFYKYKFDTGLGKGMSWWDIFADWSFVVLLSFMECQMGLYPEIMLNPTAHETDFKLGRCVHCVTPLISLKCMHAPCRTICFYPLISSKWNLQGFKAFQRCWRWSIHHWYLHSIFNMTIPVKPPIKFGQCYFRVSS